MKLSLMHGAKSKLDLGRALEVIYGPRKVGAPGIMRDELLAPYDNSDWSTLEQMGKDAHRARPKELQLNTNQNSANGIPTRLRHRRYFGISDGPPPYAY